MGSSGVGHKPLIPDVFGLGLSLRDGYCCLGLNICNHRRGRSFDVGGVGGRVGSQPA